ncbi:unnamed protein product [Thelazia callipaeda]|uniref:Uncharacterized protein n=1 Tax=Thelazia callipaeda TaxID=103827 RepID=A0A0N5CN82_THECL|nr:unnamed protein product [Thelazia callipaeda]
MKKQKIPQSLTLNENICLKVTTAKAHITIAKGCRSRKIHAKLNMYDNNLRKQELAKKISTSFMLVAVVLAFLFFNILAFVVNILEKVGLHELYSKTVPWSNTRKREMMIIRTIHIWKNFFQTLKCILSHLKPYSER